MAFLVLFAFSLSLVLYLLFRKKCKETDKKNKDLKDSLAIFDLIVDTRKLGVVIWKEKDLTYINSILLEHFSPLNIDFRDKNAVKYALEHPEEYLNIYDILTTINKVRSTNEEYLNTWCKELGGKYLEIAYFKKIIGEKMYEGLITKDTSSEFKNIESQIINRLTEILLEETSKENADISKLGDRIKNLLTEYGLVDTFGIAFLEPGGYIHFPYMKYIDNDDRSGLRLSPEVKSLSRYVIETGLKVHIRNSNEERHFPTGHELLKIRGELFTIYAAPLVHRNITKGVVLFEKQGADQFSNSTILIFDKIVQIITLSIYFIDLLKELEHDKQKFIELSIKDYLTGAYSRRFLEQFLEKELFKSKRTNSPLSVVFVDINKFKEINDKYGHIYGDTVLKNFVKILKDNVRAMDLIARYGGDEFVIVLPETEVEKANNVLDRIARSLEKENISMSYGVINAIAFDSIEDIYKELDKRMYEMKKQA